MFQRATKHGAHLRCAVFGPAGSGKTYSALRIATGLGGRIALIDTERRTARKYGDRFAFDVCELDTDRTIGGYVAAIDEARAGRYDVLVIDSLTHAWQELLSEVEQLAKARYRGNTWSAWSEGTPKQRHFIDRMLGYPGHVIVTMRSKTEWQTANDGGKVKPVRVGLTPEQGKGIEYEFDLLLELSPDHIAQVIKDRTGRYQDQLVECPSEEFGKALAAWLAQGGHVPPPAPPEPARSAPRGAPEPRVSSRTAADPHPASRY